MCRCNRTRYPFPRWSRFLAYPEAVIETAWMLVDHESQFCTCRIEKRRSPVFQCGCNRRVDLSWQEGSDRLTRVPGRLTNPVRLATGGLDAPLEWLRD